MARYSDFWLIDRGRLSLLSEWRNKPYAFALLSDEATIDDAPLPTSAELAQYANLRFADRQRYELALAGEIYTLQPDTLDGRQARRQHKRAA